MDFTEEQILSLAPDESSRKSGISLAHASKWVVTRKCDQALWGECQGSGSKPYQTQIDLSAIAFKCSCPSRKFPCKHGIALGLLYARSSQLFDSAEMPAWVAEWISKRSLKEEKKSTKEDKEVDTVAQAKRLQAREQKVNDGIEELLIWIKDIVRNGIIGMPEKDYAYWDHVAKRMIDAQAPGMAGMIKKLGSINFYKEGWQSEFLDRLIDIYLISKAYTNKESLTAEVLKEVQNHIGFTVNQDELKSQAGLQDTWLVVGKRTTEEDNLAIERNWLYGINSNRYALILQFIIRGQGASVMLTPGMYIDAELVFFPSVSPLRAIVKHQKTTHQVLPYRHYSDWKQIAEMETQVCSQFPVRTDRPYFIQQITPVQFNGKWWLRDNELNMAEISEKFEGLWRLLSLSGGEPLDMVVVGRERTFEPLGVWVNQTYKAI